MSAWNVAGPFISPKGMAKLVLALMCSKGSWAHPLQPYESGDTTISSQYWRTLVVHRAHLVAHQSPGWAGKRTFDRSYNAGSENFASPSSRSHPFGIYGSEHHTKLPPIGLDVSQGLQPLHSKNAIRTFNVKMEENQGMSYIVLYLCEKEHIEGGMIFQLLEDLTEMSTMQNCKDIFGYIESKQDILGKQELFARGKLVMLRTCNQLLRRLSKANDVVLCGRILMFLAHFFPLSERSAVNIKGVFNTSNETKYEKEAPDGISIDFNFYKTFWSLQEYFCNPPTLTNAPLKWQKFTSSLMVVLNTFEAQPLTDEEGNANDLEEDAATFSIKYLTSSKLMGLELKDPSFRRHILVQSLILFDYLKAPGKADKDVPTESMKEEIKSCEEHNAKRIGFDGARKRPRWRLGNKELSQLWKWADQNPNALTDPERVCTPAISEYWKPLADDMDVTAGIEEEYHHKNNRVYCWKGLRFAARQDLEGFSRFTDFGIEGVVPVDLLPPDMRSKYQAKPSDKSKRPKKEDTKGNQMEDQTATPVSENDREGRQS
ncbi:unnamed protein product [Rhodiola kirilowii]